MCLTNNSFSICGAFAGTNIIECRFVADRRPGCPGLKHIPDTDLATYCRNNNCAKCLSIKEAKWARVCPPGPCPDDAQARGSSENSSESSPSVRGSPSVRLANSVGRLVVRNVSMKKKFTPARKLEVRNVPPTEEERRKIEERAKEVKVDRRYRRKARDD